MISMQEHAFLATVEASPILERTLNWAAINSGTANLLGLAIMLERLAEAFRALPGDLHFVEGSPVHAIGSDGQLQTIAHGRHLVLKVRPNAPRRVLLTGHMDTVYPVDHPFQTSAWRDEDTLNGPGTADMKGGLSLMLEGLLAYERSGPALGYDVIINSDEETGSLSSAALIAELAQSKLAALTYEPALPGGVMARARPGSGNFAAVISGRSAHAGRNPEDGRNAIVAAADLAQRLHAARREGLSINPARIEGGSPNNTVPDLAILHFNMRPRESADLLSGQTLIATAIHEVTALHQVHIDLSGGFGRPPKAITPSTEHLFGLVSNAAADLGHSVSWKDTGGVCDGNNIAACGLPVIDTMGACGGSIHSPDEYLIASSLHARAQLTALVMHRLDRIGLPAEKDLRI